MKTVLLISKTLFKPDEFENAGVSFSFGRKTIEKVEKETVEKDVVTRFSDRVFRPRNRIQNNRKTFDAFSE